MRQSNRPGKNTTGRVRNWFISITNPYVAPELASAMLIGDVYLDGQVSRIRTGPIRSWRGRTIATKSCSRYVLTGPPHKAYPEFIRGAGYEYNSQRPLMFLNELLEHAAWRKEWPLTQAT